MKTFSLAPLLCLTVLTALVTFGMVGCGGDSSGNSNSNSNSAPRANRPLVGKLSKQVIGYLAPREYKISSLENQLNLDFSKYTILNYAFFGVAEDGSLLSSEYVDPRIYQRAVSQAPAALISPDFDYPLLWGDAQSVDLSTLSSDEEVRKRFENQGFVEQGEGWKNEFTGFHGAFPVPLKQKDGKPGLIELAHQHHVKLLAAIGGPKISKHFVTLVSDPIKLETFLKGVDQLLGLGFDGIDINWIYPGTGGNGYQAGPDDYDAFATLVEQVREHIGTERLLTAAFSAKPADLEAMDWDRVTQSLDYLNMITYNYSDGLSETAGYIAPLYESTQYPDATRNGSIDGLIQYLAGKGLPLEKVNFAVPFFGRFVYTVPQASFPGVPLSKRLCGSRKSGYGLLNCAIISMPDYTEYEGDRPSVPGYTTLWDEKAQVPYRFAVEAPTFLSYENGESVGAKAHYVLGKGLAGLVVWHVFGDLICDGKITGDFRLPVCAARQTPLIDVVDTVFLG